MIFAEKPAAALVRNWNEVRRTTA